MSQAERVEWNSLPPCAPSAARGDAEGARQVNEGRCILGKFCLLEEL